MSNYWQDRTAAAYKRITNKSIKEIEKQLQKYYSKAMQRTIKDFEATYDKLLAAKAADQQLTPADLYKLDKYWAMQAQLRKELERLGAKQQAALSKIFETNFFEVYWSVKVEGASAFRTIDTGIVKQLINSVWAADNKSWSERIWENINRLQETLNNELINCLVTGKKTTELKHILMERFGVSYHRADTLVRTEIAHIQTEAAKQRYQDYGIERVQFWADPDERTCPDCGALHKKIYPAGANVPLPLHPNCRCALLPVIEDE